MKQTIPNGCGTIGLLHSVLNGYTRNQILPNTPLSTLLRTITSTPELSTVQLADLISSNDDLYNAHEEAAKQGDTFPPPVGEVWDHANQHFVAFVKGVDGHLWELEGDRVGPIDRGVLGEDEDALSPRAVELGVGRLIQLSMGGGDDGGNDGGKGNGDEGRKLLRFSCLALAPTEWE